MNAWLIHTTENSVARVIMMETEEQALKFLGNVVIGNHPGTSIQNMYVIDVVAGTMSVLETYLDGLNLKFREKTT